MKPPGACRASWRPCSGHCPAHHQDGQALQSTARATHDPICLSVRWLWNSECACPYQLDVRLLCAAASLPLLPSALMTAKWWNFVLVEKYVGPTLPTLHRSGPANRPRRGPAAALRAGAAVPICSPAALPSLDSIVGRYLAASVACRKPGAGARRCSFSAGATLPPADPPDGPGSHPRRGGSGAGQPAAIPATAVPQRRLLLISTP